MVVGRIEEIISLKEGRGEEEGLKVWMDGEMDGGSKRNRFTNAIDRWDS